MHPFKDFDTKGPFVLAYIWLDGRFIQRWIIVRTALRKVLPFFFAKVSELQFKSHRFRTPYLLGGNWYIGVRNKILARIAGLNAHMDIYPFRAQPKDRLA